MKEVTNRSWGRTFATGGLFTLLIVSIALIPTTPRYLQASPLFRWRCRQACSTPGCAAGEGEAVEELGAYWYWLRSPDQEKRVVISLYNRYCIRCHGVDGRGIWDIPDVPDFTNVRWQGSRSDGQLARIILEGRGAVMPPFRGTLTLDEAWAMARYLRTFQPGTETPRPDLGGTAKAPEPTRGGRWWR